MSLDEETLQRVAEDGKMNYDKWPPIVEPLLERINHVCIPRRGTSSNADEFQVVYNEFPVPKAYPNIYPPRQALSPQQSHLHLDTPQGQTPTPNGPVIPSTPTPTRNLPPVPLFPSVSSNNTPATSQIPDSLPPTTQPSDQPPELPQPVVQLINGILKTLQTSFSTLPPHTIQRLAELILHPTKHYRTLPAWLRAVDRVISVTSTADIFPLPRAMPLPSHVLDSSLLTNGVHADVDKSVLGDGGGGILWLNSDTETKWDEDTNTALGNDESLGGALLTPIPWLRNGALGGSGSEDSGEMESGESDDLLGGPIELPTSTAAMAINGNPLVPEREDGAVTQGELIRQEQEAGVVPVGHSSADSVGMAMEDVDDESEEEVPHARGPAVVGSVDVGMVNGKGMEVDIGNQGTRRSERQGVGRGVRDAQEVLRGGSSGRMIAREVSNEADEMHVDVDPVAGNIMDPSVLLRTGMDANADASVDEDTVIPDADALSEEDTGPSEAEKEDEKNAG